MTPGAFAGDISPTPLLMILPDDALTAAPLTGSGHAGDARDFPGALVERPGGREDGHKLRDGPEILNILAVPGSISLPVFLAARRYAGGARRPCRLHRPYGAEQLADGVVVAGEGWAGQAYHEMACAGLGVTG
jgi:hypothetical protein